MTPEEARRRMIRRMFHADAEEETTEEEGGDNSIDASHGNTRLPYGLCKKYHIDLPDDATPRQAWQALEDKQGISAGEVYKKLEEQNEVSKTFKSTRSIDEYNTAHSKHSGYPEGSYYYNEKALDENADMCPYKLYDKGGFKYSATIDDYSMNDYLGGFGSMWSYSHPGPERGREKIQAEFKSRLLSNTNQGDVVEFDEPDSNNPGAFTMDVGFLRVSADKWEKIYPDLSVNSFEISPVPKKVIFSTEEVAEYFTDLSYKKKKILSVYAYKPVNDNLPKFYESLTYRSQFTKSARGKGKQFAKARATYINNLYEVKSAKGIPIKDHGEMSQEEIQRDCKDNYAFELNLNGMATSKGEPVPATEEDYRVCYNAVDSILPYYETPAGNRAVHLNAFKSGYYDDPGTLAYYHIPGKYIVLCGNSEETWAEVGTSAKYEESKKKLADLKAKNYKTGEDRTEIARLTEKVKYHRHNVTIKGKEKECVAIHELGHAVMHQILGDEYWDNIKAVMDKAKETGDIYKYLSEYSSTNPDEFFAEAYTAYITKQELPGYIRDMCELPEKILKGEIKKEDLGKGCSLKPSVWMKRNAPKFRKSKRKKKKTKQ